MSGNQTWSSLPFEEDYEGEQIAGIVSGIINAFTELNNTDNLAQCVSSHLQYSVDGAVDSFYGRYNADIIDFEAHMTRILLSLDLTVDECQDLTKEQVTLVQDQIRDVDDDTVIANLAANKDHVELLYAKMKMYQATHDYINFGSALA